MSRTNARVACGQRAPHGQGAAHAGHRPAQQPQRRQQTVGEPGLAGRGRRPGRGKGRDVLHSDAAVVGGDT
ncbi:hypothetical protein [Streptomyces sp. NPDC094049]|uniref:hypothetical protein n=1 Tax=Streptomyces sp. NPDC094049 TaxID=3154987 RepID=UPI00331A7872